MTRTCYLGQFVEDNAERITAALEDAGIAHHAKQTGGLTRWLFAGEWGVRLFVDAERFTEARDIAARIAPDA